MNKGILIALAVLINCIQSVAQDIKIVLEEPKNTLVGSTMNIAVAVESTYEVASVFGKISEAETALVFNQENSLFEGFLSLEGFQQDTITLKITAADIFDNTVTEEFTRVYDTPPILHVSEPLNGSVARPTLRIKATCIEEDDKPCEIVVTIDPETPFSQEIVKTNAIDTVIDYSFNQSVRWVRENSNQLWITAIDSRDQKVSVNQTIYFEPSPYLKEVASVQYTISDWDGSKLLTAEVMNENWVKQINIVDFVTLDTTKIPVEGELQKMFLTPQGAIIKGNMNDDHFDELYEWKDNELKLLDSLPVGNIDHQGDYVIWASGLNEDYKLNLRNISTGSNVVMSSDSNIRDFDVAANGIAVYSVGTPDYDVYIYRDGMSNPLTSDNADEIWNQHPVTDGNSFVYTKTNVCCNTHAIALHDGNNETIIREFEAIAADRQINDGFLAYAKSGNVGQAHIWLRAPDGNDHQITFFGTDSQIELLNNQGDVMLKTDGRRYLANKIGNIQAISAANIGKGFWADDKWFLSIGRTLFEIDTSIALHTVNDISKTIENGNAIKFNTSEFVDAFEGPVVLAKIKITSLPENGILKYDNNPIEAPFEIFKGQEQYLMYEPASATFAEDSFSWNASNGLEYAASEAKVLLIPGVTGMDETLSEGYVSFSPNPTEGMLVISFSEYIPKNARVRIVDLMGQVIWEKDIQNYLDEVTINMSFLKSGIYIVQYFSGDQVVGRKVIKY